MKKKKKDFSNSKFTSGISDYFTFDEEFRKEKMLLYRNRLSIDWESQCIEDKDQISQFQKASELLSIISVFQNPIEKLQLLSEVVDWIKQDVDGFWEGVKTNFDEKCIDAYNLEKILSYVVIKSNYSDIFVDLAIIESFTGSFIDFWWNGFIYASLSSTVNLIIHQHNQNNNETKSTPNDVEFGINQHSQLKFSDDFEIIPNDQYSKNNADFSVSDTKHPSKSSKIQKLLKLLTFRIIK